MGLGKEKISPKLLLMYFITSHVTTAKTITLSFKMFFLASPSAVWPSSMLNKINYHRIYQHFGLFNLFLKKGKYPTY